MEALRQQRGVAARALEFAILTAARTGEVIGTRWCEINVAEKTWTVPAARMKAGIDHRVPLSARAVAVLELMRGYAEPDEDRHVFRGATLVSSLSNMSLLAVLKRMDRADITTHGFRSVFRDWAAEAGFPREVAKAALAHVVGNKVEAAYLRTTLFDRRRTMMDAWSTVCCSGPTNEVSRQRAPMQVGRPVSL